MADMSFSTARLFLAALSVAPIPAFGAVTADPKPDAAQTAFFEKNIRPVLST